MDKIKLSSYILKLCCIAFLIQLIIKEVDKMMKGSMHEDNFFTIHDDFVLMTANDTITYMKENSFFHCWFLTMNVFQDGTPYYGRSVDNSPKFMPLYNSLNRDI